MAKTQKVLKVIKRIIREWSGSNDAGSSVIGDYLLNLMDSTNPADLASIALMDLEDISIAAKEAAELIERAE